MPNARQEWRNSVVDQVATKLRNEILRQGLKPGDRLPTYRQLEQDLGVAYWTVKRGVDALVMERVVDRIHGKGLFVAESEKPRPAELRFALLIFPTSLHHVMSHVYSSDLARGVLSGLAPGYGIVRSMLSEGIVYGDHVAAVNPSAVIMMGVESDEYLRMAVNWGRPLVAVDYCSEGVPIDFVACDNRAAARRCVEHLAGLGHRRLAYLNGGEVQEEHMRGMPEELLVQRSSDVRERREGVLAAAADLGLPQPRLIESDEVFGSGSDRPTALVLDNELNAPWAMRRLAEMGLRVPDDLSVCAVAGTGMLRDCPNLTLCKFDFYDMGRKAVEALRAQMARPGKPVNRIHRIGFEWVEGGSTREARA